MSATLTQLEVTHEPPPSFGTRGKRRDWPLQVFSDAAFTARGSMTAMARALNCCQALISQRLKERHYLTAYDEGCRRAGVEPHYYRRRLRPHRDTIEVHATDLLIKSKSELDDEPLLVLNAIGPECRTYGELKRATELTSARLGFALGVLEMKLMIKSRDEKLLARFYRIEERW